jgi:hypothetical protein
VLICIGRSRYDDDGSGEIDAEELQGIMENLGVSVTEEEIEKMVLEIDEDGSGEKKRERESRLFLLLPTKRERESRLFLLLPYTKRERERQRDQEVVVTRIIFPKTGSGHARAQEILLDPKRHLVSCVHMPQAPSILMSSWPWLRRQWPTMLAAQAQS